VPKLIAELTEARRELAEWHNGTMRKPCEHDVTALNFAEQTLRAYEARDAAVAELARVKTKYVAPALYQLETIRTEQIMVAGFPEAATAISHARVALGDVWPEVGQDRTGYVDELEALRTEVEALRAQADGYAKHVGAPTLAEAWDVLLRTKQQDEEKIESMFSQIKTLGKQREILRERLERFVARVEAGTIKSTWTYEMFKQALEETADVTPS
jgi:hypothetical protein